MPVATPRSDRIAFRRNCIFTVCSLNIIKNLIRSICFVGKNITFGQFKARQKFYSYCRIIDISCCKQKFKRIPQRVCKGMNLGVERSSEYALENIFSVIDWRYRSGKPLIITTNLPLAQLKQETKIEKKRIYDRILERCIPVKIDGASRREAIANDNMQTMKNILKI